MNQAHDWIVKAIESSTNQFHLDCCRILIELFYAKYGDQELETDLKQIAHDKEMEVLNILH